MAYGYWQQLAENYFPTKKIENTAELYNQVAKKAAHLILNVNVISSKGLSVSTASKAVEIGCLASTRSDSLIDSTAYTIGYRAHLNDGATNTYDELDSLVEFVREVQSIQVTE